MGLSEKLKQSGIEALEQLADFVNRTEVEKLRLIRVLDGQSEVDHAYQMGRRFHQDGPDGINCHFLLFLTRERCDAWERGCKDAKRGGSG